MNFNDLNKYQKAKVIASGCTAVVVFLVLIFMLNVYLSREIPQLEEGLEVMMGMENAGAEDFFEPTPASEIAQELQEVSSPETASDPAPSDEAYQTQDIEESVQMKDQKTEEELKKLFLKASSRAKCAETKVQNGTSYCQGAYSYEKLRNSWLYKQLYINITNKSALDPLERKVKKALFVVGANIA